jgi:hypothetical protein
MPRGIRRSASAERLRRPCDAVLHRFAHPDAPLPHVAADVLAERGLAVLVVPDEKAAHRQAFGYHQHQVMA